jgi:HAD superfamily hydrolase (TIGR01549 family)
MHDRTPLAIATQNALPAHHLLVPYKLNTQPSPPGKIKAVALDVFGTLAEITDKRRPYAALARTCQQPDSIFRIAMTAALGLAGLAHARHSTMPLPELAALEQALYAELASVRLFPEVPDVLNRLRAHGYRLGIVSNLAAPYAVPIKLLLPFPLDAYAWSFECGAVKPEPGIYATVARQLNCLPAEILMVGDTYAADYAGARAQGFQALLLDRNGAYPQPGADTIPDLTGILGHLNLQGG